MESGRKSDTRATVRALLVWLLRVCIGAVFVFSGFAKGVDPWGTVYKIQDYLAVWHVNWLWREMVFAVAVFMSVLEFTCGVTLLTGCLRRSVCWVIMLMMTVLLPLTVYVYIYNPVADCGCFGEAFVISNSATLLKNIAITAGMVYLVFNNSRVAGLYPPLIQWMVIAASIVYCSVLGFIGMTIQPMMDFRPYKVGSHILPPSDEEITLVYSKDGVEREFSSDSLPDSAWTFVRRVESAVSRTGEFAIFDNGDEVAADVIAEDGPQVLLLVADPSVHRKARSGMANALNYYITSLGGSMAAVVALPPDSLDSWRRLTNPNYDVYTSDDTTIKEVARGDASVVYLEDGVVRWKRNIYSLPGDFPDFEAPGNVLERVRVVDDGTDLKHLTCLYVIVLGAVFMLGLLRFSGRGYHPKHAAPAKDDTPTTNN